MVLLTFQKNELIPLGAPGTQGGGKYYCSACSFNKQQQYREGHTNRNNINITNIRGINRIPCAFQEHGDNRQACRMECQAGTCNWALGPHCIYCRFR